MHLVNGTGNSSLSTSMQWWMTLEETKGKKAADVLADGQLPQH